MRVGKERGVLGQRVVRVVGFRALGAGGLGSTMGYLGHRRSLADPSEYRGALCYNHYFCPGAAPGAVQGSEVRYGGSTVTFPDRRNGKYKQKKYPLKVPKLWDSVVSDDRK